MSKNIVSTTGFSRWKMAFFTNSRVKKENFTMTTGIANHDFTLIFGRSHAFTRKPSISRNTKNLLSPQLCMGIPPRGGQVYAGGLCGRQWPQLGMISYISTIKTWIMWVHVTSWLPINMPYMSEPGPWFNMKMSSYQYRKSHCGDKTVVRSSYLHNGISYTCKQDGIFILNHPQGPISLTIFPSQFKFDQNFIVLSFQFFWTDR